MLWKQLKSVFPFSWMLAVKFGVFVCCLLFLTILLPALLMQEASENFVLEFELTADRDDQGQIFFAKDGGYSEAQSSRFDVFAGSHKYTVLLAAADVEDLSYLRFDPAVGVLRGRLQALQVRRGKSSVSEAQLVPKFRPLRQVTLEQGPTGLAFQTLGVDPHFELRLELGPLRKLEPESDVPLVLRLLGVCASLLLAICFLYRTQLLELATRPASIFCFCLCVPIGALIFLVPSFQSPDEFVHFERANIIARGQVDLKSVDSQVGGYIDPSLHRYMAYFNGIPHHPEHKLSSEKLRLAKNVRWQGDNTFAKHNGTSAYLPIVYLPQALGVVVGQALKLTVHQSYLLAKFAVFGACLIVLIIAFRIFTPPVIVLLILGLPMLLFQLGATSIDGFTVSLAILALSMASRLIAEEQQNLVLGGLLLVVLFCLAGSRPYLLPMFLIPAYLAFLWRSWPYLGISVVTGVCVLVWLMLSTTSPAEARLGEGVTQRDILLFYLLEPSQSIRLMINTLQFHGYSYLRGFIGILGWYDTHMPLPFYCFVTAVLTFTGLSMIVVRRSIQSVTAAAILTVVSICCVGLIFIAMLLNWTVHPAVVIEGVQGRYFTIPGLILAYAATQGIRPANNGSGMVAFGVVFLALTFSVMISTLLMRFYI